LCRRPVAPVPRTRPNLVIAVDPGRDKCGVAVVRSDGTCPEKRVVAAAEVGEVAAAMAAGHGATTLVIGDRTGSRETVRALERLGVFESIVRTDEHRSTEEAKELYFREQPPRGLRRLIPAGFLRPPEPLDHYAAWVLGRRFFGASDPGRGLVSRTGRDR